MALFRNKKDAPAIAEAFAQVQRAQDLAAQSTAQVERETGMSVQAMQAQGAAMAQSGQLQQLQAYAARSARLFQTGVDMPGLLRGAQFGQHAPMLGGIPAQVQVTVEPPGGASYDVSIDQVVNEAMAATLVPGQPVTVRVDPADPHSLMIWGVAPTPAATAPGGPPADDREARLARLRGLLESGVLTDAEYQAAVAREEPQR